VITFDLEVVLSSQLHFPILTDILTPLNVKAFSLRINEVGPFTTKLGKTDMCGFCGTRAWAGPPNKSFCIAGMAVA
jgi:hypothetical protein